jgi:hypothetical protein
MDACRNRGALAKNHEALGRLRHHLDIFAGFTSVITKTGLNGNSGERTGHQDGWELALSGSGLVCIYCRSFRTERAARSRGISWKRRSDIAGTSSGSLGFARDNSKAEMSHYLTPPHVANCPRAQ